MSVNRLFDSFKNTVVSPVATKASEACCSTKSLGKKIYNVASTAFSGIGNWPFYGVAASFGNAYSSALGGILGGCEFGSYFAFRIRNFAEIRQKLFGGNSENEEAPAIEGRDSTVLRSVAIDEEKERILPSDSVRPNASKTTAKPCANWKAIAMKTGIAALGIVAQFPIMVLAYYGNGENLFYPLVCGACEASFTILSLLLTFQSAKKSKAEAEIDSEIEDKRNLLVGQINRFLQELPSKYKDPIFAQKIDEIFSNHPPKSEEQRGKDLLQLVFQAKGLPPLRKGSWDSTLNNLAKGVGFLVSCYLTTVNGAVSYKGVKAWRDDQEALAVLTTIFVSLANVKLMTKLCMDSATSYFEGIRDLIKNQYRPPLAHAVSPIAWYLGRAISTIGSWLSFGTTATAARDYIPKVGTALIGPAPLSSALLLNENLNWSVDDAILWANSKCDSRAKQFTHLNDSFLKFKEKVQDASPETLRQFLDQVPDINESPPKTPSDVRTPLLMNQLS